MSIALAAPALAESELEGRAMEFNKESVLVDKWAIRAKVVSEDNCRALACSGEGQL
jgi:hypothetical protein